MKKTVALFLMLLLAFTAVWANGNSEVGSSSKSGVAVTPAGTFPIVNEEIEMSIFVPGKNMVDDMSFDKNAYTQYVYEKTNIKLEVDQAGVNDWKEKLNVMMASGDYPEILVDAGFEKPQQLLYGQQGVLLPLNDLIDEYGINVKRVFNDLPTVEANMTLPDGNVYGLPDVNDCFHCAVSQKFWIYQPWLDKLGLEIPETTDELYEVLKAFKTQDPNGNGIADEIPLAGAIKGVWNGKIDGFIMSAFVHDNMDNYVARLNVVNGKITPAYTTSEWKQGLEYLNKLYREGLLAPESFIQDQAQMKQLTENPDVAILGALPAGAQGAFSQVGGDSNRWLEYVPVAPLEGPNGLKVTRNNPVWGTAEFFITNMCENPEAAFRLGDAWYEMDMMLFNTYGRPGIEQREAEAGEVGINGKPALWVSMVARGDIDRNSWWNQAGPHYRSRDYRLGRKADDAALLEIILYESSRDLYWPNRAPVEMALPPLSFDENNAAEVVEIKTVVGEYVEEMIARFVTDDADLDKDWDSYLEELEKMGLSRMLEIMQNAMDEQY